MCDLAGEYRCSKFVEAVDTRGDFSFILIAEEGGLGGSASPTPVAVASDNFIASSSI